ncbi:hypothetical protein P74p64 [Thermus phage P74-26]|uniref:Uncharacterized protein n=1 Tax=Thermus phage P74-26 TaxID=2914007 RepID=A7XXN8_BP742|nr:hypothetical protein P74p64 [Thermus phage P74-26]ABU97014.1 hypothetical protein P74p64 [Thermus phage P74-26]
MEQHAPNVPAWLMVYAFVVIALGAFFSTKARENGDDEE